MTDHNRNMEVRILAALCALLVLAGTWTAFGWKSQMEQVAYASSQPMMEERTASDIKATVMQIDGMARTALTAKADKPSGEAALMPGGGKSAPAAAPAQKAEKVVYLTFDDGPSLHTADVLDILAKENIKGTFFVLGQQAERNPKLVERIVKEGHAIGNHSYNHEYKTLYSNFSNFWDQIKRTGRIVEKIIGYEPVLVRAPGGTIMNFDKQYFELMDKAGYLVYDWHVDSADSKRRGVPAKEIAQAVKKGALLPETVVLMHDGVGHGETVKALPDIIAFYKSKGYTFSVLSPEVKPVQFHVGSTARWKRTAVSSAWIQDNLKPVATSMAAKDPMTFTVETGQGQIRFEPDQFMSYEDRTYVPLRMLVEKLNGTVNWDVESERVNVEWNQIAIEFDVLQGQMIQTMPDGMEQPHKVELVSQNKMTWVPLREVLDAFQVKMLHYELEPVQPDEQPAAA
ncbi:polysaccharide deacetylase [Paenibacillus apiarius]|uniref:Polysaccharide deacetylase n=1 Tax=Paenibacillus apiarius TaxID=46240 RepID=A0ABT4DZG3_9BACL|nr:polysaccharide deacetylase [Paenibacillus apiarius]MCY9515150.1 polysaccharide deacetylase [Paenibacillus apiarius]MCY9522749.1 polysaccharide deacetylase [Paenibacillus apiarius]MCY9552969.1 polysaccharide deacetylase [Paenibacillus apiarius]MCY9557614.1 polysaccharide deacetylase [Paenibacillus apiarius]MCY9686424.1 polysaccharide deacetylase [Paenibacillus apiarius]